MFQNEKQRRPRPDILTAGLFRYLSIMLFSMRGQLLFIHRSIGMRGTQRCVGTPCCNQPQALQYIVEENIFQCNNGLGLQVPAGLPRAA